MEHMNWKGCGKEEAQNILQQHNSIWLESGRKLVFIYIWSCPII